MTDDVIIQNTAQKLKILFFAHLARHSASACSCHGKWRSTA